ncbi:MAG: hypothetical protein V9G18_10365 [Albidovulum sp.]
MAMLSPPSQGRAVRMMPANPVATPAAVNAEGRSDLSTSQEVTKVTIGIAPPRSPATLEGRSAVPATKP